MEFQQFKVGGPLFKPIRATLGCFAKQVSNEASNQPVIGIISAGHFMGKEGKKLQMKCEGLYRSVATVRKVSSSGDNVDCGFAVPDRDITDYSSNVTVNGVAESGDIGMGDHVYFHGSTSKKVLGLIISTRFTFTIEDPDTKGKREFTNQLRISQASQGGDSGALVIGKENNHAVGLLFANIEGHGVASPIRKVEEFLGVKLITVTAV